MMLGAIAVMNLILSFLLDSFENRTTMEETELGEGVHDQASFLGSSGAGRNGKHGRIPVFRCVMMNLLL